MSRFEDEEEDELQMILEGRDVETFREYNYESEYQSKQLVSHLEEEYESDSDSQQMSYKSKKQKLDKFSQRKDKTKVRIDSSEDRLESNIEKQFVNELNENLTETNDKNETKIKAKVKRTLKPQPKLDVDRLMSSEGLPILTQLFSDFKFGEKGSELKDLNAILFRLSHWSHRLFPSFTFDDFIDKCEQLGNKRGTKNLLSRIRTDKPLDLGQNEIQPPIEVEDEDDLQNKTDFDYIIGKTLINENNEKSVANSFDSEEDFGDEIEEINDFITEDKEMEDIENLSVQDETINNVTQIKTNINENFVNNLDEEYESDSDSQQISYKSKKQKLVLFDDSNEEMSEEEILKEINSDESD